MKQFTIIVCNSARLENVKKVKTFGIEMARAANSPVFGPSATVLKQSASNFFSDDVIPGRYRPLQSARQKFCFLQNFIN